MDKELHKDICFLAAELKRKSGELMRMLHKAGDCTSYNYVWKSRAYFDCIEQQYCDYVGTGIDPSDMDTTM